MTLLVWLMVLALVIPLIAAAQQEDIWSKLLAFASVSTKTSVLILVMSVVRDDWMIGVVGVLILSVGNAALMLLAQVLKRLEQGVTR
jgi:multicomponent Na+:H+ antiporter subunit F